MVLNIHDSVLGNQEEIVLTKVNLVTTHAWSILPYSGKFLWEKIFANARDRAFRE